MPKRRETGGMDAAKEMQEIDRAKRRGDMSPKTARRRKEELKSFLRRRNIL